MFWLIHGEFQEVHSQKEVLQKSKGLGSLSVGDGFFENLIFFPILKDRLTDMGVVNLLKFLVRFHCVYSGELEEKNVLRYPDKYKLGRALHSRLGILLKTSHKDRRIGRSRKENDRRILTGIFWQFQISSFC